MSVEDRKGIALGKIPRWESQLWSYVGSGDGEDCPIHDQCQINKRNGWCPGAHRDYVNKLLDMKKFNKILEINDKDLTVTVETGTNGMNLERYLNAKGYTTGHIPQSLERRARFQLHPQYPPSWLAGKSIP